MNQEKKNPPPTYQELFERVAVLSQLLEAHLDGKGEFDKSGRMTRMVLDNLSEEARKYTRRHQRMEYTLQRVKQGFYNLIHAEALPSEGWDYAVKELIDSIERTLAMLNGDKPENGA